MAGRKRGGGKSDLSIEAISYLGAIDKFFGVQTTTIRWSPVILLLTVAACDDRGGRAGTYRLQEVNGSAVPMLASRHVRGQAEIIEGAFTLNTDGSYRARTVFRVRSDTVVYLDSTVHTGRYTSLGDSLIFRSTPGDRVNAAGQLDGSSLTFRYPGWAFVYRRAEGRDAH